MVVKLLLHRCVQLTRTPPPPRPPAMNINEEKKKKKKKKLIRIFMSRWRRRRSAPLTRSASSERTVNTLLIKLIPVSSRPTGTLKLQEEVLMSQSQRVRGSRPLPGSSVWSRSVPGIPSRPPPRPAALCPPGGGAGARQLTAQGAERGPSLSALSNRARRKRIKTSWTELLEAEPVLLEAEPAPEVPV
ncbi:hypothetical protein EYF80_049799 [Liparis tanakae]|uniref:Uncharacterized protein n=1 Tax=Liparis tanakae TaxID=230148 RepID=A0A4Z2FFP4_9TELE|nr:hypothetical protein EYF80_049799 [Liparis tanakae]